MRPSPIYKHITVSKNRYTTLLRPNLVVRKGLGGSVSAILLATVLNSPSQAQVVFVENATGSVACLNAPPGDDLAWIQDFLETIKRLYQLLGGDPQELNGYTPVAAMDAVYGQFQSKGVGGLTVLELIDAISVTVQLDAYLAVPPPSINPDDFSKLSVIETALHAAK
jgi:hypothetical protein